MAVFGDYETIGDPWFMTGRHGQIRSYWRAASRVLDDRRVYFIKSIALPGLESSQEATAHGPPLADAGADFVESVTRLQEGYRAYPELIAPIHAFGRTDTEVWYATDVYPRFSLARFDSSAAHIDNRTLEHVVCCIARGCLALQRATGLSHGNLKTGNVLIANGPGPLKRTPLHLIDPASVSKRPQGTPAGNVRDATELRDLRGIGEIILELVEGNPIDGPGDYTLPIEHSVPWRALGKNSQRWLDLCNRLLDPVLSLDAIRLESLAKDLSPRSTRTPVFFAGLSLMAILAIASYSFWAEPLKQATTNWARDTESVASAQPPAPNVTDSSGPVAENATPAQPPSRLNTEDTAAPSETDNARGLDSSTSQRLASAPANTDAGIGPVDSHTQPISPGPAEIAAPPPEINRAASPSTTQAPDSGAPARSSTKSVRSDAEGINSNIASARSARDATAFDVTTQAPGSGASARSSTGSATSNSDRIESRDTESKLQTRVSYPKPVSSARPPASSNPQGIGPGRRDTESTSQNASAEPKRPQVLEERKRVPAQRSGQREALAGRPPAVRPAEQPGKGSRSQAEVARTGTGRTLAKVESPTQGPPTGIARLNEQLRELEAEVARVVAIRRNSELFAQVAALEAQYAKANQLSSKTIRRFELLRLNMARKLPGPQPERPSILPVIPPVVGR